MTPKDKMNQFKEELRDRLKNKPTSYPVREGVRCFRCSNAATHTVNGYVACKTCADEYATSGIPMGHEAPTPEPRFISMEGVGWDYLKEPDNYVHISVETPEPEGLESWIPRCKQCKVELGLSNYGDDYCTPCQKPDDKYQDVKTLLKDLNDLNDRPSKTFLCLEGAGDKYLNEPKCYVKINKEDK